MVRKTNRTSLLASFTLGAAAGVFYNRLRDGTLADYYWWPALIAAIGIWLATKAWRMSRRINQEHEEPKETN